MQDFVVKSIDSKHLHLIYKKRLTTNRIFELLIEITSKNDFLLLGKLNEKLTKHSQKK